MSLNDKLAGEMNDPELAEALKNFKASVDAWSDAAYTRPRTTAITARHGWRLAAGWALGCALAAASLAGGVFEHQHRKELAKAAAVKAAAQNAAHQRLAAERSAAKAQEALEERAATEDAGATANGTSADENLMATVDSDVSQGVPAAMEPLALMMENSSGAN